jgi:hypothetical protein
MRNGSQVGIMNTVSKLLHYFVSERFTVCAANPGFSCVKMKKKESEELSRGS